MVNNEFESKNPRMISYWNMMAGKFEKVGLNSKAIEYYKAAKELCTEIFGPEHSQTMLLERRIMELEVKMKMPGGKPKAG